MANDASLDATRIAIEFLTLWLEPDRAGAAAHISDVLKAPVGPSAEHVIAGLLNLNMFTIYQLAKASGAEPDSYRAWAGAYLQRLSPNLPGAGPR